MKSQRSNKETKKPKKDAPAPKPSGTVAPPPAVPIIPKERKKP
ncbi:MULTISPECIES: hypothetical protein [Ideonella]|jgi:hypothetical protein|nr:MULTISPECIES: hypothetical protein [Ideonella]HSI51283.1 hypothetical protein [Ideonella sp.]